MGLFDRIKGKGDDAAKPDDRSVPAEVVAEETDETPTLQLITRLRSAEKLFEDPNTVKAVSAFGNTTLLSDDSDELKLIDEYGNLARDFDKIASKDVHISWSTVGQAHAESYIGENRARNEVAVPSDLGFHQENLMNRILPGQLREDRAASVRWNKLGNTDNTVADHHIVSHPELGYIAIGNAKSSAKDEKTKPAFVVYVNRDKDNKIIPEPRNWIRISSDMPKRRISQLLDRVSLSETALSDDIMVELERVYKSANALGGIPYKVYQDAISIEGDDGSKYVDKITAVSDNICLDPSDSLQCFYCQSNAPEEIYQVNMDGDNAEKWEKKPIRFPKKYADVQHLTLHPLGTFFTFKSGEDLILVERDTLQEIGRLPHADRTQIDANGLVRTVDDQGHFVIADMNLDAVVGHIKGKLIAGALQGADPSQYFRAGGASTAERKKADVGFDVGPIRRHYATTFQPQVDSIGSQDDAVRMLHALDALEADLQQNTKVTITAAQAREVTAEWRQQVRETQKTLADREVQATLDEVRGMLGVAGGITAAQVELIDQRLAPVRNQESLLSEPVAAQVRNVRQTFESASREVFVQQEGALVQQIRGVVAEQEKIAAELTDEMKFRSWQDFDLPAAKTRLINIGKRVPPQCLEASRQLSEANVRLDDLERTYTERFRERYDEVRRQVKRKRDGLVSVVRNGIDGFIERLSQSTFETRAEAEEYIANGGSYDQLQQQIAMVAEEDEQLGLELRRHLESKRSGVLARIDRFGTQKTVEGKGNVERFGTIEFPVWEGEIKEKKKTEISLTFLEDKSTKGAGIKAKDVMGTVGVRIRTSKGKEVEQKLWEGRSNADDFHGGSVDWHGESIPESYITRGEYDELRKKFIREWKPGGRISERAERAKGVEVGTLKQEYEKRRDALKTLYARRKSVRERDATTDAPWQKGGAQYEEYKKLLEEFAKFCSENQIALLQRLESLEHMPEPEYANGKGSLVEWQDYWVLDPDHDIPILDDLAERFNVQLATKSGAVMLEGPTGAGKDVYLQMYAERSGRPYFSVDCSKWTTEFELSQDVSIGAEGGVAVTVKEDSAVLQAISTPGAILYFNEFNALPHPAQIFLHSLLDDKRSLQLKTSGGRIVKAAPNTLFAASMNWGYEGTNAPNEATMSRFSAMTIGYPPFKKKIPGVREDQAPYSAAEALRIARDVDSLADASTEADMDLNKFVGWWNAYVNGNGSKSGITPEKQFDLRTIFVLVDAANRLRKKYLEQKAGAFGAGPSDYSVSNPITSRELRRCAKRLSAMTGEEKAQKTGGEVEVAIELLTKEFLPVVQPAEDREKLLQAMKTWVFELAA